MDKITKEKILSKFSKENMADLLIGARIRTKKDKELIEWLMNERERLTEEIKERGGYI